MAFTERGVRFPLHQFVRRVLLTLNLTSSQLTVNSYRIITSIVELKRQFNLTFGLEELFIIYLVGLNRESNRYYLSCRTGYDTFLTTTCPISKNGKRSRGWAEDKAEGEAEEEEQKEGVERTCPRLRKVTPDLGAPFVRRSTERTGLSGEMAGPGTREVLNLKRQRPRQGYCLQYAGTSRVTPVSPREPPKKKARHEEGDGGRGMEYETILIEDEEPKGECREETGGGEGGTWVHPKDLPWALEFCHYAGHLIHHADSICNLSVAFGMLWGCIFPWDAKAVQGLTEDITGEIAQALFTAGARALAVNDRCKGQEERVLAEGRATRAEEDTDTLRVTRAKEVDSTRNRGYDEGSDAAGVEYNKQVRDIEAKLYLDHFLEGLRYGHETLVSRLNLLEDSEQCLRRLPRSLSCPKRKRWWCKMQG
ncbi:hypothetical protein RHMOL_Rhmol02G0126900 [Rhododendron molle]|uniref:Uncharacterized protein n=1 Tax=Rhododendron molle TaxID=49168 RepID=A0ACC0PQR3_RHOML|nr:hypothetical protein RHMOL_Rhmol02G0126900 [Rhododendron molle]